MDIIKDICISCWIIFWCLFDWVLIDVDDFFDIFVVGNCFEFIWFGRIFI